MNNKSPFGVPLGLGLGGSYNNGASNQNRNISKQGDQFSPRNSNSPFNSSPRGRYESDFIPLGFSSPVNQRNGTTTPTHWKVNRRFNNSNSFNSSGGRNTSPYNNSDRFNPKRKGNRETDTNPGHATNITQYYHPSMLEDPWVELESKRSSGVGAGSVGTKLSLVSESGAGLSQPLSDSEELVNSQDGEKSVSSGEGSS